MKIICAGICCALALLIGCSAGPGKEDGGGTGGGAGCNGVAKNPPNLVPNNGFECGDQGWSPQSGTLEASADPHTGSQSAKLVATGSPAAGTFAFSVPVVEATSGKTYCAQAYLKGAVADAILSVRELYEGGGGGIDHTFSTPVKSTTWIRTPPSTNLEVRAAKGSKLYVRLVMRTPMVNDTLFVDDVDVWESPDGLCKETR